MSDEGDVQGHDAHHDHDHDVLVYELGEWTPEERSRLALLLEGEGIPHEPPGEPLARCPSGTGGRACCARKPSELDTPRGAWVGTAEKRHRLRAGPRGALRGMWLLGAATRRAL